jgi:hypothetical protein
MSFTPIPRATMQAYWRMEDANDSSGNARTLTDNNTVTFGAAKFSNGALFNNSSPFNKGLSRNSNPCSVLRPTNLTFSFWFKLTNTTSHADTFSTFFSLSTSITDTTGMAANYTYTIVGSDIIHRVALPFSGGTVALTFTTPAETAWHYYVVVKEGLAFRFYRDCVLLNSGTGTGNEESTASGSNIICVGNDRSNAAGKLHQCKGILDELILEERAWTLREIRLAYGMYKGFLGV